MPYPKNTRFVRDGEVDPGVRDAAMRIGELFNSPTSKLNYHSELFAWFWASAGVGLFTYPREYVESHARTQLLIDPADPNTYMIGAPESHSTPHGYPQYHSFAGNLTNWDGTKPDVDSSVAFNKAGSLNILHAEFVYRSTFKGHPKDELIVEALMFFDPSARFAEALRKDRESALDIGITTAEAVASGVPLLGKKWIIADLVSYGITVDKAATTAEEVYFKGGNYLAFKKFNDRFYAVTSILRKADPLVSDAQIRDVANSALSLDLIESVAKKLVRGAVALDGDKDDTRPPSSSSSGAGSAGVNGTTVAVAAGAGALGAFAFGGPVGLAIGAGVLILGSLGSD